MIRTEQLYYLVKIAEYNSITMAARELFMTKSAISTAINNLEKECGFAILERSYRGIEFTKKGKLVLEYAKVVLQTFKEIEKLRLLPDLENELANPKTNLYINSRLMNVLQGRIIEWGTELFQYYKIIEVDDLFEQLETFEKEDVAIELADDTIIGRLIKEGWWVKVLYESQLFPVSKKNTRLIESNKTKLEISEIYNLPKVLLNQHKHVRRKYGLDNNVVLRSQNASLCNDAILNDYGIGFVADFSNTIAMEKRKLFKVYEPIDDLKINIILLMKDEEHMEKVYLIERILQ